MKSRSRTEIASAILTVAECGATRARIMYKAYVSYTQLHSYLSFLIAAGLLEHDAFLDTYETTAGGMEYLKGVQALHDMMPA